MLVGVAVNVGVLVGVAVCVGVLVLDLVCVAVCVGETLGFTTFWTSLNKAMPDL